MQCQSPKLTLAASIHGLRSWINNDKQIKMKEDIGGWNQIHWNDGLPKLFFFQLKVVREISQDGLVTKDPIGHSSLCYIQSASLQSKQYTGRIVYAVVWLIPQQGKDHH